MDSCQRVWAYLRGKEETLCVGSVGRQNRARLTALGGLDSLNLRVTDDLKPAHVIKVVPVCFLYDGVIICIADVTICYVSLQYV